jgi:benzaldehyde dehydrogenase (NAD)
VIDKNRWHQKLFLGEWQATLNPHFDVTDKATGKVLSSLALATPTDVSAACEEAIQQQIAWCALAYEARAAIFYKAAELIEIYKETLTFWMIRETGSIRMKVEEELRLGKNILYAAGAMLTAPQGALLPNHDTLLNCMRRCPLGVIGLITPFNFPFILAIRVIAPALATGNAVVLKPDLQTPLSGGILLAYLLEEAGLPKGLLHVLPGGVDVGEALCVHPNVPMICFTGSTQTGRRVNELCAPHLKKVLLELGGKNSLIILEDADIELAISNAAFGAWLHQGQICMTSGRILVSEKIADRVLAGLVEKAQTLVVGDPTQANVALGPIINQKQIQQIDALVQASMKQGARLKAGGTFEGLFYRPTVLDNVTPGMPVFEQEIFGPVACITRFKTEKEALELANQTEYGLSGSIIAKDVARALALGYQLKVGSLHINDQTVNDAAYAPLGGRGISGNGGRIGGLANWDNFTQWQWITIKDKPLQYLF